MFARKLTVPLTRSVRLSSRALTRQAVKPRYAVNTIRTFSISVPRLDRIADAEQQIKLGTEYLNQGSIDMAMNSYHKSVQLAPSAAGYFNIGVCYFQMGKHRDAIEAFKKSLEFQPNQADAHTNIASAYLMLKNVKEAVQHLEQASNFNPLDGEIQYNLGCVYEATGNLDGAKTRFERAEMLGIPKAKEALEKLAKKL